MSSEQQLPLSALTVGNKGKVMLLLAEGALRRRLLDLGVVADSVIEVIRVSPAGDPTAYLIRGSLIGLRKKEAHAIIVNPIQ